jgi:hypothetical protein
MTALTAIRALFERARHRPAWSTDASPFPVFSIRLSEQRLAHRRETKPSPGGFGTTKCSGLPAAALFDALLCCDSRTESGKGTLGGLSRRVALAGRLTQHHIPPMHPLLTSAPFLALIGTLPASRMQLAVFVEKVRTEARHRVPEDNPLQDLPLSAFPGCQEPSTPTSSWPPPEIRRSRPND